jgi:hypothetical protein
MNLRYFLDSISKLTALKIQFSFQSTKKLDTPLSEPWALPGGSGPTPKTFEPQ